MRPETREILRELPIAFVCAVMAGAFVIAWFLL